MAPTTRAGDDADEGVRTAGASAAPRRTGARRPHAGWPRRRRRSEGACFGFRARRSPICGSGSRRSIAAPEGSGSRRSGCWTRASASSTGHAFVVLHGAAPVLAGWALEAIVEHHGERGTVRAVGELGEHLDPEAFQSAWCEHCGVRRRRSTTFVVVHVESGELRQVGSDCVRDFLGGHDPERACRQAEYLALARAELKGAEVAARPPEPALEAFAMHASHVVRAHGFISREQARCGSGPASADLALRSLQATPDAPDAADRALAGGALRWAQALPMLKGEPVAVRG